MIRYLALSLWAMLAALPAAAIDIQEVTSPGGIKAWLVEEHSIPFTALEIRFRGGASLDAPGKRGEINLMTGLIEEGAGNMNSEAFAAAREALAAKISFDVDDDALSVSAKFLTDNRDKGVDLLRTALNETRFDQDAIDRVRGQVLSIIAANAQDPGHVAGDTFSALAFCSHPYGSSLNGTQDSIKALTRQDMLDAKARVMARDRVYVAATGDITPEELGKMIDRVLGGLPATGAPMPPRADLALKPGVHVTEFDTPQSVVIFGQPGLRIDNPDFFPAYVLNQLLGGSGFTARLMNEVREKRGLTYGIASYLAQMDLAEIWQGSFASANEKVADAIKVVKDEWARAASGDIAQSEVDAAKTYLTGSYPLRFDGNGPIADILVGMQMQGLPIGYVTKRNSYIEAVTLDDVKRVAKKWLKPDALQFVVVGKPVGLAASN